MLRQKPIEWATEGERRFKEAAIALVHGGIHPTPTLVNKKLGRDRKRVPAYGPDGRVVMMSAADATRRWTEETYWSNNLNGKEVKWLREVAGRVRRWRKEPAAGGYPLCTAMCCEREGYVPVLRVPGKSAVVQLTHSSDSQAFHYEAKVTYVDQPTQEQIDAEAAMWAGKGPGLSFPGERRGITERERVQLAAEAARILRVNTDGQLESDDVDLEERLPKPCGCDALGSCEGCVGAPWTCRDELETLISHASPDMHRAMIEARTLAAARRAQAGVPSVGLAEAMGEAVTPRWGASFAGLLKSLFAGPRSLFRRA